MDLDSAIHPTSLLGTSSLVTDQPVDLTPTDHRMKKINMHMGIGFEILQSWGFEQILEDLRYFSYSDYNWWKSIV